MQGKNRISFCLDRNPKSGYLEGYSQSEEMTTLPE
jgi:hypothetical protein